MVTSRDESRFLREVVDEQIAGLFTDDEATIAATVSRLLERLPYDEGLEETLVDTLQLGLDLENDDTRGSVWIALLLGEAAVSRAVPVLLQAVSSDDDEELQCAAGIALLRCGTRGVEALLRGIEDDSPSPVFLRAAFGLLGCVGSLRDEGLLTAVKQFLTETLDSEVIDRESDVLVEGIALAAARLGHRELLPRLRDVQRRHFLGRSPPLDDAIEMLEEGPPDVAFVSDLLPGEEEYAWAFEYRSESFRARRGGGDARDGREGEGGLEVVARVEGAAEQEQRNVEEDPEAREEAGDLETFYRGLGAREDHRRSNGRGKGEEEPTSS